MNVFHLLCTKRPKFLGKVKLTFHAKSTYAVCNYFLLKALCLLMICKCEDVLKMRKDLQSTYVVKIK